MLLKSNWIVACDHLVYLSSQLHRSTPEIDGLLNVYPELVGEKMSLELWDMPLYLLLDHLAIIALLDRLLQRRPFGTRDPVDEIAVLEDRERRHQIDAQLLRNVRRFLDVVIVEPATCASSATPPSTGSSGDDGDVPRIRILLDHLLDEGRHGLALRAPARRALEHAHAVGHGGFDVGGPVGEFLHPPGGLIAQTLRR